MKVKDVIVIGGGPAGYTAAIRASQLGAKVTLVEKDKLGGTCLNRGCIPTKALMRSVELIGLLKGARTHGIDTGKFSIDLIKMMKRKDKIVQMLEVGVYSLMRSNAIEIIKGRGELTSTTKLTVKTERGEEINLKTERIILAPGSVPSPFSELQDRKTITTDDALKLQQIPESIVIIGGGAIGVEFATIFAKLGASVTLLEKLPHIIPTEDDDLSFALEKSLKRDGIQILTDTTAVGIEDKSCGSKSVTINTKQGEQRCETQLVLNAIGRKPCIEGFGLEKIGLSTTKDGIKVNEKMETNIDGIYAAGDAVGGILQAHIASAEGIVAAENVLGGNSKMNYDAVPRCIYTLPEIGAVGLTSRDAESKQLLIEEGVFPLSANGKALILGERDGFIKILTDANTGEIIGCHIFGPQATELIAEATLAMKMKVTIDQLLSTLHAHPTLSEAIKEAAFSSQRIPIHGLPQKDL